MQQRAPTRPWTEPPEQWAADCESEEPAPSNEVQRAELLESPTTTKKNKGLQKNENKNKNLTLSCCAAANAWLASFCMAKARSNSAYIEQRSKEENIKFLCVFFFLPFAEPQTEKESDYAVRELALLPEVQPAEPPERPKQTKQKKKET